MHILSYFTSALGFASQNPQIQSVMSVPKLGDGEVRPVVIWHGLGDNYNSSGIHRFAQVLDQMYPGIYVHSVYIDKDPSKDENKSLFGDANDEVEIVCQQLRDNSHLSHGFDAIGFSQGGVLLRGLVERCSDVNVHNLITFGSPHMGVMELPMCEDDNDWFCKRKNALLKKQVWHESVQKSVIPAQYFRDPYDYDKYMLHSHYLADINNEKVDSIHPEYADNFAALNLLVLVTFLRDTTVVPRDSAEFLDLDINTGEKIPFDRTDLYNNDLVGLKRLNEANKVLFRSIDDVHMRIPDTFLVDIANEFLGNT